MMGAWDSTNGSAIESAKEAEKHSNGEFQRADGVLLGFEVQVVFMQGWTCQGGRSRKWEL